MKVGIDFHNLSTVPDRVIRTGIQQVVFYLLDAQHWLRHNAKLDIEIVPLPTLPHNTLETSFSESKPTHVSNSWKVLTETASELGVKVNELWNTEFSNESNWSEERFYESVRDLDWFLVTGLCDFRAVNEKMKSFNPELKTAVFVYDLIPSVVPQLTVRGMPDWFESCYLDGLRHFADIVLSISRHTAIDCEWFLRSYLGINVPIISTTLPPEVPSLTELDSQNDLIWLNTFGLHPKRYFVCLGTIEPRKNLILAVRGFIEFIKRFPKKNDFKLCMIGKTGWNDEDAVIQKEVGLLGDKVVFAGYLDRLSVERIVHYSSGLAMPSRYEGFGMPLTLAHERGIPTVSTINSSLPEAAELDSFFINTESAQEMSLAFFTMSETSKAAINVSVEKQEQTQQMWRDLLRHMLEQFSYFPKETIAAPNIKKQKKKILIEVHNLSINHNALQKTGIQEVVYSILHTVAKIRSQYEEKAEIICIPFLPSDRYSAHYATTFNCSPKILQEIQQKSGLSSKDFWGFDFEKLNFILTMPDFVQVTKDADHFIVTSQYDVRRLYSSLKMYSPNIQVSYILYDIIPTLYPNAVVNKLSSWFTNDLCRTIRSHASKIFGISRSAALDFSSFFEPNSTSSSDLYCLRLPINQSRNRVAILDSVLSRLKLEKKRYFAIIGNNDPRKNVKNSILAFIRFCELFSELSKGYSLILIGPKGWKTDPPSTKSDSQARIIEAGYLSDEDMHSLVKSSCGIIMASRYEGFGIPLALARSYGVPTITCQNSSLPEVTELNTVLIDPNNTTEMALGIRNLLTYSKSDMIENDNWEIYVRDLIELHL